MTICSEWSLVKHTPEFKRAKPLYCRSWGCEVCRPRRKAQLMALCAAGAPVRFLTLTHNPRHGEDPHERLLRLSWAWRTAVKRLKRIYGKSSIAYLAIVEETKAGEPHLHILLRSPYIPQHVISRIMAELIDSPIVDIRKIRSMKEVVRYVAKYVTKAPAQFGSAKRYWRTSDWDVRADTEKEAVFMEGGTWIVSRHSLARIWDSWKYHGFELSLDGTDGIIATYNPAVNLLEVPNELDTLMRLRNARRKD